MKSVKKKHPWRDAIQKFKPKVVFNAPATRDEIRTAEKQLKAKLPDELTAVLLETNGAEDWLLSTSQLAKVNQEHRADEIWREMTPNIDDYLFFMYDGTGSHYAYDMKTKGSKSVGYWCHETGEFEPLGKSIVKAFETYLR